MTANPDWLEQFNPEEREALKRFLSGIRQIPQRFDLPANFLTDLQQEDDWSLVIKFHATIETTLAWYLQKVVEPLPLNQYIATLDLSGGRHSKIAFAEALGVIERDEIQFIRWLSTMRNRLVHNIRHAKFSLNTHVKALTPDELSEFQNTPAPLFAAGNSAKLNEVKAWIKSNPRECLITGGLLVATAFDIRAEGHDNTTPIKKEIDAVKFLRERGWTVTHNS